MTATTGTDFGRLFADFAKAARGTALRSHLKGDFYAESLAEARATVYDEAARLIQTRPAEEVAAELMSNAKAMHVRTAPFANFDMAGVRYTIARAWQFCAWQIDATLPQAAPKWD